MERTRLELLFDQELLQNAEQARILCGSPVTRFVRSVQTTGGVSAVRELCRRNRPSDAFDSLAQAGRLDLSAEASAVKGKYGPLFTDEEVNACLALLLEAGFLAIFLGPSHVAPPAPVIWLLCWLLFRVEFGAGLIKMRGDSCWRDLTALHYHHETQPMPGPLSRHFHRLPGRLHKVEVLANHVTQLLVPFLLFAPQPVATAAGLIVVVTQGWLMLSGNFAWLNFTTITLAFSAMGGWLLRPVTPTPPAQQ